MSESSVYDDPEIQAGSGAFVEWTAPPMEVEGDVIAVERGTDFAGNPCPQLVIRTDDGADITMTAGQAQLKAKIMAERPERRDRVRINYTADEKRQGGKTLKLFTVEVTRGGAKGTAAVAPIDVATAGDSDPF